MIPPLATGMSLRKSDSDFPLEDFLPKREFKPGLHYVTLVALKPKVKMEA